MTAVSMATHQQELNCSISLFIGVERVGAKAQIKKGFVTVLFIFILFSENSMTEFRIQERHFLQMKYHLRPGANPSSASPPTPPAPLFPDAQVSGPSRPQHTVCLTRPLCPSPLTGPVMEANVLWDREPGF